MPRTHLSKKLLKVFLMISANNIFILATFLFLLSLIASFSKDYGQKLVWSFLLPAVLANSIVLFIRYLSAWPMLPMYLEPVALPFCLAFLTIFLRQNVSSWQSRRLLMGLVVIIALITIFFPKDFYLPFLKSNTWLAHLFFFLGLLGEGCFLVASVRAIVILLQNRKRIEKSINPSGQVRSEYSRISHESSQAWFPWVVWGFVFWTLSMFAGELWSYLGWGTPVVWDDPAITAIMATWFFYVCLLHLHLTGTWTVRGRTFFTAVGLPVVLLLNYLPELGPFRYPF